MAARPGCSPAGPRTSPNPGDYFLFDDLRVPIIVIRGKDSVVRAFYNTCQHRGAPVVREAIGHRAHPALPVPLVDLRHHRPAS